jgi:hypothetical protein
MHHALYTACCRKKARASGVGVDTGRLLDLAEDNVEMDFDAVFMVTLKDGDAPCYPVARGLVLVLQRPELILHLQVAGAKVGLTENGGGMIRGENAVASVHILSL